MQITVHKCPDTGRLFESTAAYKKHLTVLAKKTEEDSKEAQRVASLDALVAKMLTASSLSEYFEWFNELELAKNVPGRRIREKFIAAKLTKIHAVRSTSDHLSIDVDIFTKSGNWSSWSCRDSPSAPGFHLSCGSGDTAREGAPKGANHVMHYQGTIDLSKLPGLLATRSAIVGARAAVETHAKALLSAAQDSICSRTSVVKKQEAIDAKSAQANALRAQLSALESEIWAHDHKLQRDIEALHARMLAASPEPAKILEKLESRLPVAPFQTAEYP